MIHDTLQNFRQYAALNPRFAAVAEFLEKNDLKQLSTGKHEILPDGEAFANVQEITGRNVAAIPVEAHRKYIDVQIPLGEMELMGWMPYAVMQPENEYNAEQDMQLSHQAVPRWETVLGGEFIVFFPGDAHAPGGGAGKLRKIIVKVRV